MRRGGFISAPPFLPPGGMRFPGPPPMMPPMPNNMPQAPMAPQQAPQPPQQFPGSPGGPFLDQAQPQAQAGPQPFQPQAFQGQPSPQPQPFQPQAAPPQQPTYNAFQADQAPPEFQQADPQALLLQQQAALAHFLPYLMPQYGGTLQGAAPATGASSPGPANAPAQAPPVQLTAQDSQPPTIAGLPRRLMPPSTYSTRGREDGYTARF